MNIKNSLFLFGFILSFACVAEKNTPINREALVKRNNPEVIAFDPLSSLSVGNGEFAFTVDITGLQTFPKEYEQGIPLGTQAQWGWYNFPNPKQFRFEETLKEFDFRKGHPESYPVLNRENTQRNREAVEWFRANSNRLYLGLIGLELGDDIRPADLQSIDQELDIWNGIIHSRFSVDNAIYNIQTVCHPRQDMISAKITSSETPVVNIRFGYPTGAFADFACNLTKNDKHSTVIINQTDQSATLKRIIDSTIYYVKLEWQGSAVLTEKEKNYLLLTATGHNLSFNCSFTNKMPSGLTHSFDDTRLAAATYWQSYWKTGAAVDFSLCTHPEANELERRVVLSQYLLAIQSAGSTPPQETGLTYNSWYGKFHLEMIWWHQAQFALWGRPQLLERTLPWYNQVLPVGREVARRQGYDGVRWMKMTDPSGLESPSSVGPFLIWQQPHIIYFAELIYRINPSPETIEKYYQLICETADFMYSFAMYDEANDRYILNGIIPAQETLRPETTINPPFELSYWYFGMQLAQQWRERAGQSRKPEWDTLINKLSVLAEKDGLYLAAESAPDTYQNISLTSDHMAVLGAYGILPDSGLFEKEIMRNTLHWIWDNWNWDHTWGWDFPMIAMNAARMGEPEKAVGALLMDK